MARRLQAIGVTGYENGFRLMLMPHRLSEPLERRKPTVYFVNSMSDLFHEKVPFDYVHRVFDVMARAPQHTFQVLTKRAERMAEFCRGIKVPADGQKRSKKANGRTYHGRIYNSMPDVVPAIA